MANKVMWFEVLGKDGNKLKKFYGELFGWQYWTMLIAVPSYTLIAQHGTFRFHHAVAIGGVVGFMDWATLPFLAVLPCVALGLFAGIAFWSIVAGPGRLWGSRDGRDGATSRPT